MLPRALGREIHAENQNFEKSRDKIMKTEKTEKTEDAHFSSKS